MKYLKLFEKFTDGDNKYPFSITVIPTAVFERKLKGIKNSEGEPSFLADREFTLRSDGDRFNLVKVATTPYEPFAKNELDGKSFIGKQDDYWLSYHPEKSEIYVHISRIFGTELGFDDKNEITSINRFYTDDYRDLGLIWIGGYHCKFEKGFEVGMRDQPSEYFEIVSVR